MNKLPRKVLAEAENVQLDEGGEDLEHDEGQRVELVHGVGLVNFDLNERKLKSKCLTNKTFNKASKETPFRNG